MSLRAVIFDFDGVIANSEPLHLRTYQEVLAEANVTLTPKDYYTKYLGYDDVAVFKAVMNDQHRDVNEEILQEFIAKKSQHLNTLLRTTNLIFPGVIECIRHLAAKVPLAIASGALLNEINIVLKQSNLNDCFSVIVSADNEGIHGKPAPDPYLKSIELLKTHIPTTPQIEKSSAGSTNPNTLSRRSVPGIVAIEDSHWGIQSAKAAGLLCVAVSHTYRPDQLQDADLVVENTSVLTFKALQDLCNRAEL